MLEDLSNGKAKLNKTQADNIVKLKREQKKQQGLNRRNSTGMGSTIIASGNNIFSNNLPTNNFLSTSGGTMIGPLAIYRTNNLSLYPKSGSPPTGNNNTLDISKGTEGYSSYIYWVDAGSRTLDTISGAEFSGQILCIQNIDTTATTNNTFVIRDVSSSSSNIKTLDGNNVTLGPRPQVIMFIYSDITGKWQQISNPQVSSGSSWVGTATSNLDMNTYDIEGVDRLKFSAGASSSDALLSTDYGIEIEGASASPSGLKYNVPSSKTHKFYVNAGSAKMTVSSSNISFNEDLFMNSNGIYLDNDQDTYFVSTSDDNISIATGGSSRLSISDFGLYMYSDIVMNSYDIDLNGNELILDDDKDSYIQSVSDDTIQVVTSGTLRLQVDNSLVFANQDIGIITGSKLKGFFGVIGLQVSSSSLTVGSSGSLQVPYLSSTTTYSTGVNSTLDGIFGNLDGCMGIQYNSTSPTYTVWYRLNGGWRRNFLT